MRNAEFIEPGSDRDASFRARPTSDKLRIPHSAFRTRCGRVAGRLPGPRPLAGARPREPDLSVDQHAVGRFRPDRGEPLVGAPDTTRGKLYQMRPSRFAMRDRKSTRLNSSHLVISYAVFCLK